MTDAPVRFGTTTDEPNLTRRQTHVKRSPDKRQTAVLSSLDCTSDNARGPHARKYLHRKHRIGACGENKLMLRLTTNARQRLDEPMSLTYLFPSSAPMESQPCPQYHVGLRSSLRVQATANPL